MRYKVDFEIQNKSKENRYKVLFKKGEFRITRFSKMTPEQMLSYRNSIDVLDSNFKEGFVSLIKYKKEETKFLMKKSRRIVNAEYDEILLTSLKMLVSKYGTRILSDIPAILIPIGRVKELFKHSDDIFEQEMRFTKQELSRRIAELNLDELNAVVEKLKNDRIVNCKNEQYRKNKQDLEVQCSLFEEAFETPKYFKKTFEENFVKEEEQGL